MESKIEELTCALEDLREEVIRVKLDVRDILRIVREGQCSFVKVPFVAQHTVNKEPPFFKGDDQ